MNPEVAALFAESRRLASLLKTINGGIYGVACAQGQFAVTVTRKVGRRSATSRITEMQSYGECLADMRQMVEGVAA